MSEEIVGKTVFIGGISRKVRYEDVEDSFKQYGSIMNVKMKGEYAFVEFKHEDDCDQAIREMSHKKICGHTITVQKSYGGRNKREEGREENGKDVCFNCGNKGHW
jgi:arginine/serine-rich splicing factor 7